MPPDHRQPANAYVTKVLIAIGLGTIAGVFFLVVRGSLTILMLIFAGVILGICLQWLKCAAVRTTHLPSGICLAILLVLMLAATALLMRYLTPVVVEQAGALLEKIPDAIDEFRYSTLRYPWGDEFVEKTDEAEDLILGVERGELLETMKGLVGLFSSTFGIVTGGFFIVMIGIYIAADMDLYFTGVIRLLPPRFRAKGADLLRRMGSTIRWWLIGQCISMTVLGVIVYVGLRLMGLPFALFFGLLTALMTFIPNLGPLLAFCPIALVALSEGSPNFFYLAAFYIFVQSFEGFVLTPTIHRKIITLPPVLVISVQILLLKLIGLMGVVLAMPLVACAMVAVKIIYTEEILGDRDDSVSFCRECAP